MYNFFGREMYDFFKCQNALHQQDYVQFNCDGLKLQIAKILCLIFFEIFLPTIFSLINFFSYALH